jgi:ZIP family zinc transporter
MTITLTIHNLPEGFAVAFSAFTNIGPIMALAIGMAVVAAAAVGAAEQKVASSTKQ